MRGKFAVVSSTMAIWRKYKNGAGGHERAGKRVRLSLRGLLKQMCDQNGKFRYAPFRTGGLAGRDALHAVTFVENHDTDHEKGNQIVKGKMLAYAYILTCEGLPTVFYRDYSMDGGCYHLKPLLDKLIAIHETLASGATQTRWKDEDVFAYERMGGPPLC